MATDISDISDNGDLDDNNGDDGDDLDDNDGDDLDGDHTNAKSVRQVYYGGDGETMGENVAPSQVLKRFEAFIPLPICLVGVIVSFLPFCEWTCTTEFIISQYGDFFMQPKMTQVIHSFADALKVEKEQPS
jgi:hypothetical protein